MMETLKTLDIEGNYLNIITICETLTVNIIFNGERLIAFPLKIRNKARMPSFTICIQPKFWSEQICKKKK